MRDPRIPTFLILFFLAAPALAAGSVRVDLLGGQTLRGSDVAAITADEIRLRTETGEIRAAPLADLVSLSFPNEAARRADYEIQEVEIRLRDGDVVRGSLRPGERDRVEVVSPLLGSLGYLVDAVREIRFLNAWEKAPKRPAPAAEGADLDEFYYRSLDRLEGTYSKTTTGAIAVRGTGGSTRSLDFEELLLVRFADWPGPELPDGRLAVLFLVDGSRLTVRDLRSDGRRLKAVTVRDQEVQVDFADLLAVTMKGGRFVYLSDREPTRTEITPWLGEVYAWDRPRFDRSFVDRALRAGGERYLKGIGVISGTTITFAVPDGYETFTSLAALDDAAGEEGDVVFEVLVDGESRFRSDTIRRLAPGDKPLRIPAIEVAGAREISLRVTGADDFVMDFADWLDPMLIREP